jgi:hypothetical protein
MLKASKLMHVLHGLQVNTARCTQIHAHNQCSLNTEEVAGRQVGRQRNTKEAFMHEFVCTMFKLPTRDKHTIPMLNCSPQLKTQKYYGLPTPVTDGSESNCKSELFVDLGTIRMGRNAYVVQKAICGDIKF